MLVDEFSNIHYCRKSTMQNFIYNATRVLLRERTGRQQSCRVNMNKKIVWAEGERFWKIQRSRMLHYGIHKCSNCSNIVRTCNCGRAYFFLFVLSSLRRWWIIQPEWVGLVHYSSIWFLKFIFSNHLTNKSHSYYE